MTQDALTVERQRRVAENEAAFRDANERIRRAVDRLDAFDDLVPFICECARLDCGRIMSLSVDEYEHVRDNPRTFVCAPGHESAADGETLEETERYVVVLKDGPAGQVAEARDPRGS